MPAHVGRSNDRDDAGTSEPQPLRLRERRRPMCGTWRTSPPRPSSPTTTVSAYGASSCALAIASAIREVGAGLADLHTARDAREHVVSGQPTSACCCTIATSIDEAPAVERLRDRAGQGAGGGHDQRLHLDAQRPRASSTAATTEPDAPTPPVGEKQRGRIGDRHQPLAGHLDQPELVGGAEAVLQRAEHPQRVVAIPSNESTVSTTCSRVRGPASEPSLVT